MDDERRDHRLEIAATALLALAAIATAWATYQSSVWRGNQAEAQSASIATRVESTREAAVANRQAQIDVALFTQWVDAYARDEGELASFYFNRDNVRLAEIDAALAGSSAAIRRDPLRLFGDVILEIDVPQESTEKLLADLKSVNNVKVEQSQREGGTLLVTLKLPAPEPDIRRTPEFGQIAFQKLTFRTEGDGESSVRELPTYGMLRKIVEKHDARLQGLRWNCWGCRALGCVAGTGADRSSALGARAR